jgi:hypothetical protein
VEIAAERVAGLLEETLAVPSVGLGPEGGDKLVPAEAARRASSPSVFRCWAAPVPGTLSMSTESPPKVLR